MGVGWRSYKHRFLPWLALNWSTRQVQRTDATSSKHKEETALTQATKIFQSLNNSLPPLSPQSATSLLKNPQQLTSLTGDAVRVMTETSGFSLALQESRLSGGGKGVFVSEGEVPEGCVVALYPGTVYLPSEPLLLASLSNQFVFRCEDGWHIDGNHKGLSRLIYKSCALRSLIGQHMSCDLTWLSTTPVNPLAVGQFVNNHTRDILPNVEYIEFNIPLDFPVHLMRFIPNVFYGTESADRRLLRSIALLSTRRIKKGQEIYSSYLTMITS